MKWFNTTKGLRLHRARRRLEGRFFVHISGVERSGLTGLADNQKVKFDLEKGRDGRESAVNIELNVIGFSYRNSGKGRAAGCALFCILAKAMAQQFPRNAARPSMRNCQQAEFLTI